MFWRNYKIVHRLGPILSQKIVRLCGKELFWEKSVTIGKNIDIYKVKRNSDNDFIFCFARFALVWTNKNTLIWIIRFPLMMKM